MANLTLRSTTSATDPGSTSAKGSALTHTEMDSNFILLQADIDGKISAASPTLTGATTIDDELRFNDSDDSNYITVKAPATVASNYTLTLPTTDGNANEVLITDGSGNLSWSATYAGDITEVTAGDGLSGGGASGSVSLAFDITDTNITKDEDDMVSNSASHLATQQSIKAYVDATVAATNEVVEDTTPQLGGDLDVNGNDIVSVSNGNIVLAPNGTGELRVDADVVEQHSTKGILLHDQAQGGYTDLTGAGGATKGALYGAGIVVEDTDGAPNLTLFGHKASGATQYPNIWSHRSKDDGAGNKDFLDSGDILFSFFGAAWDGTSGSANGEGTFRKTCSVEYQASEDHSATDGGGKIVFYTTENGTQSYTGTQRLTIDDDIQAHTAIRLDEVSAPTNVTDKGFIYAKDVSGTAEVFVMDAAGNETQISPHNAQGEWQYYSKNIRTGKTVRINMEQMIRDIEQLTGKTYIENE